MTIQKNLFGKTKAGQDVYTYTMQSESGMAVTVCNFGATITSLLVPSKNGIEDVVCGYDDFASYENADGYLGAVVGRFGNRIAKGKFTLDGQTYTLNCNDGENHLHGGKVGFSHKIWDATVDEKGNSVTFSYLSPDGEEGYPGNLQVSVRYQLAGKMLRITYKGRTDKKTVWNLTNHSYFNLSGNPKNDILSEILWMDADRYVENDEKNIPTGRILSVANTPFDFREGKTIGRDFNLANEDLKKASGYDHCLLFTPMIKRISPMAEPKAKLYDSTSGRTMEVYTTMPGMQLYTANFMCNPNYPLKNGVQQEKQHAVCFETECIPDSMNHENFTDCTLEPDATMMTETAFVFDW